MTRIDDVARLAGVSTATVSRALRGLPTVSEATRQRVRLAAEQLGYTASPSASRLAGGKAGTVAVLVPRISSWFSGAVVDAAEELLRPAGYDLLLRTVGGRSRAQERLPGTADLPKRVDAVLLVATPALVSAAPVFAAPAFGGRPLPGVTVAAGAPVPGWPSVGVDDVAAARTATEHLLQLGHRRIVCLSGDATDDLTRPADLDRRWGYREAMLAAGTPAEGILEFAARAGVEGGRQATAKLLARGTPPTGIVATCDELAMGAIVALCRAGLRVPADVSVIGVDGHQFARAIGLSTVAQPAAELGRLAAGTLLDRLSGARHDDTEPGRVILPTRLILRETTAPPRAH
ncbi:LacI family DNA-binding transcriptional regulator [Micromonospora sp. HM5-17]|uniref:LacI family DNA-binding transcriptional regulator n=1 Tax=Micromonospora sp. HM5-17 TaxID=2487710 RepID=UPI000F47BED1|nr:LacI family DNA-binding transcriptional regulator [Micromonospora sp. HM5-17]ROT32407.1 LacI family transcriptional regulator [Micromonospora sp. HM5-17]